MLVKLPESDGSQARRERLLTIDRMTAFAIILVVVGHVVSREPPANNEWYVALKYGIYQFHMPFFMFLSGFVFLYTMDRMTSVEIYFSWCRKKIARLAPGFLLVGTAILFGKIGASQFLHVDNLETDIANGLIGLFVWPKESVAGSLWYIYALLIFYLLFPVLIVAFRHRLDWLLVVTALMHLIHLVFQLPSIFMLNGVFEYAMYFSLGCLACLNRDAFHRFVLQHGKLFVALFAASFMLIWFLEEMTSKTVIGLASIPALYYLVGIGLQHHDRLLLFLSTYTFTIYLMNTIAIGLTKGILLKFFPWDGLNFLFYFPVLTLAGLIGPILVYRILLVRNGYLARVMN